MPDINLLQDTKQESTDADKARKIPPGKILYTNPVKEKNQNKGLVKPSGLVLWFKSLFRRRIPNAPKPSSKPKDNPPSFGDGKKPNEPEDIFASIPDPGMTMVRQKEEFEPMHQGVKASRVVQEPAGGLASVRTPFVPNRPVAAPEQPSRSAEPVRMPSSDIGEFRGTPTLPNVEPFAVKPADRPAPVPPKPAAKKKDKHDKHGEDEFEGVNLLPEELMTNFNPNKRLTTLGLAAAAAVIVVGIVFVSLQLWKQTQVQKTDEKRLEVIEVLAKISRLKSDQKAAIAFKASNERIIELFSRHVYWTKFFDKFEQYTLPTVYYPNGIQLSVGSGVSLTGIAPDMETILQQLAVYQAATDFVSTADIATITRQRSETATVNGYTFVVDLTFNPTLFYRPISSSAPAAVNTNSAPIIQ